MDFERWNFVASRIITNFALQTRGLNFPLIKEILRGTSNDFRNRGIPIGKEVNRPPFLCLFNVELFSYLIPRLYMNKFYRRQYHKPD